jgi:hypothetical protein
MKERSNLQKSAIVVLLLLFGRFVLSQNVGMLVCGKLFISYHINVKFYVGYLFKVGPVTFHVSFVLL